MSCEIVATFLKVPLTSLLAFGGVGEQPYEIYRVNCRELSCKWCLGGLAIGLSARDMVANFLGGLLLLFHEPFTPGVSL